MSTDRFDGPGGKELAHQLVGDAKELLADARESEEQLDLLDPPTAEEMAMAQDELGPKAGALAVQQHARAEKRGRKKGSKNKRTDDFAKYLLSHGRHPAITMMEIQSTAPEVLVERSKALDPVKRRMTYQDAQSLRVRCAEGVLPYIEGKQPVRVDATIRGVLVQEIIGSDDPGVVDGGEVLGVAVPVDDDGEGEA